MSFFGEVGRATRGGIGRGFNRMVEARQRQVRRYVNGALLQLDDDALAKAGYKRSELERSGSAIYPF